MHLIVLGKAKRILFLGQNLALLEKHIRVLGQINIFTLVVLSLRDLMWFSSKINTSKFIIYTLALVIMKNYAKDDLFEIITDIKRENNESWHNC